VAYLLDTNVCVDYLTGRYPAVLERIRRSSPDDLRLSTIVVAELRYGADHSGHRKANHRRIDLLLAEIACLDFDLEAAAAYGRLRAAREASGRPIGPNDMLIGAHALARGLTMVTDNLKEFRRIRGLTVENWRLP
jgi:tRNA(fMet)-specific endonuclease VapC